MAATTGIRETVLGAELGFDRVAMRARRQHLPQGQWWKDGATILWSEEAAAALRESVNGPEEKEETRELYVIRLVPNDRMVLCDDGNGGTVPVMVKRGTGPRLLRKPIRVKEDEDGTLVHQRY